MTPFRDSGVHRTLMLIIALGVVVVAAAAGLSLVQSVVADESTSTVAREAQVAIGAESTLSSAAAVRNSLVQAAIVVEGADTGLVDIDQVTDSASLVREAIVEFTRRSQELAKRLNAADAATVVNVSDVYVRTSYFVLDRIIDPEAEFSLATDGAAHAATLADVNTAIVAVRDTRVNEVLVAGESVGAAAEAIRFLVIVVIPLTAMVFFRRSLRKRREHERLELEFEHQKEVISAKDQFIANLSHELRTPLTSIYGFAHVLSESPDPATSVEVADMIIDESARLGRMVDDLITAGQIDSSGVLFVFEDVLVSKALDRALQSNPTTGSAVASDVGQVVVRADRQRFEQVLVNLIANADMHGGDLIDVVAIQQGATVSVRVIDDGDGLDPDQVTDAFDKYVHRGETPLLTGTIGMGLSVARGLVEGMDGRLTYHRADGRTVFEIVLPTGAAVTEPQSAEHPGAVVGVSD